MTGERPTGSVATRGMVTATTGAAAVDAGVEVLRQGGSAADAVAATALTQVCLAAGSWVSYAGIFSMVYFDAASGRIHNLNAGYNTVRDETDPAGIPGIRLGDIGEKGLSAFGYDPPSGRTALVPGFMAGIEAALERFGKVPLTAVFAPAIRCAEQGFTWALGNAQQYAFRAPVLARLPETKSIFTKPDGSAYAPGELFKQPALAETLRRAAQDGVRNYMYLGEWARRLVEAVRRDGGFMTLRDLADYQVLWSEPAHGTYKGYDIYSQGLPASGGVNLIEAMHLAEIAQLSQYGRYTDSPLALYWLAQIAKPAYLFGPGAVGATAASREAAAALGLDLSLRARVTKSSAAKLWSAIESGKLADVAPPRALAPAHSDSIVAIDQWGNMAAVVHSINTVAWGATGIFVDGISIPDSAAFQQAAIAAAGPGARLPEPTNPGVILKDSKPILAFGSIGSGLHIRTVAALIGVLDFAQTPQQAINEPSLGSFEFGGTRKLTVGRDELTPQQLQAVRDLGQEVAENDPLRGYWIGIQIDPHTRELHGGSIRELALGGRAVGY